MKPTPRSCFLIADGSAATAQEVQAGSSPIPGPVGANLSTPIGGPVVPGPGKPGPGTICVLTGGRVAEELRLNRLSSGAGEDFERTTELAHKMVTESGMSESLGPLAYGKQREQTFLGREIAQRRDYSEATAGEIDREVKRVVIGCYDKAHRILEERAEALTRVAEALLAHETLDAEQIAALVDGKPLPMTPEPSTDSRERLQAAREREEAGEGKRKAAGVRGDLPMLPDPRPA